MKRSTSASSSSSGVRGRRTPPPRTATSGAVCFAADKSKTTRVEYEVEPRVRFIEQQLQEKLPAEWRAFAGKPMAVHYYDKRINTFRENEHLKPGEAYVRHAVKQLREQLALEKLVVFRDEELREIVLQEWRTDLTRSVWQARLNRHGSKDGPVVRRSKGTVITVTSQPTAGDKFVVDELAQPTRSMRRVKG